MSEIEQEIEQLKKEKNAVILAHYYVPSEVQALADYVGDSFYLAKVAKRTEADTIVFCGVGFMGESAKLLNPDKTVLMPDPAADCPMAHMADPARIAELRAAYPDLAVVCYINSTAELKAHSDVCVTSSNALKIVRALPNEHIFFIPDKNLGRYVAEQVPEKHIILNDGYCPVHEHLAAELVAEQKRQHPDAVVLAHPECGEAVLALADYIGSTAEIIDHAGKSPVREMIVCTEEGVCYQLERENPEKQFYFTDPHPVCADMKKNTPERVLAALREGSGEITVSKELAARAMRPLERMLALAK